MIGEQYPYLVAEVGSNHLGSEKLMKNSIIQAKKAGANCVKFQIFNEDNLVNKNVKVFKHVRDRKIKYQYQRFKKVKISTSQFIKYSKFAKKIGLDISVTPFDVSYVKLLKKYVKFLKVASGDLTNIPLLKEIAKSKKEVVISTGMASDNEILKALSIFKNKRKVTLLHCISCYPTKLEDSNLTNIHYLKKFNTRVGYSDHTAGINAAANSVFFGAKIIEKHFMPKRTKLAGDYDLSIDEKQLKELSDRIKENFLTIGNKRKKLTDVKKYLFLN